MTDIQDDEGGFDFPLYIEKPDRISITSRQFDELNYMGLASFFISTPVVIKKTKDKYEVYMSESNGNRFVDQPRFKGCKFWVFKSAEMVQIDIPIKHALITTIDNYFSHLIMR